MNSFMNQFWIVCKLISRKNCRKDKSKLLRLLSQQSALHIYCFCSYSLSLTSLLHRSYGVVLMTILDFFLLSYPRKIHDGMAISVIIGRNMGTLHKSKSRGMALVLIDSSINECNAMNKSLTCIRTSRA